ncbi:hypothetical protein NN561_000311 [Cricetulus griseus]
MSLGDAEASGPQNCIPSAKDQRLEAIHLGSLIAAQGYIFPISDHVLTMKDDSTFYRFQENLARLQRAFARKWEFIFMQAEAQVKIDRKKDKTERKILDSQERAFWDVHRPVSVYGVTEESQSQSPVHIPSQPIRKTTKDDIRKQITFLNAQIDRHCLKMSKVAESLIAYTEQYVEYDPFITPAEPSNPWISDDITLWDIEMRFWLAVQDLKKQPLQDVAKRVEEIWQEFLAPGAPSAINLDSHSYEITSQNVKDGGRYTFEDAQEHIYKLMKSDSYARFLRSNAYQDLLLAKKKKARKNLLDAGLSSSQPLQAALREVTPAPGLKYKAGAFKKGWGTRVVDPAATSPSPRPLPSASAFPEERFGEMSLQKSRKAWTSVRKPFQVSS